MDSKSIPAVLTGPSPAPLWQSERSTPPRSASSDMTCDTVVVGAGITGLAIAENLSRSRSVVVLDAAQIGSGSSGWNAGILSVDTTVDLRAVEDQFGQEQAEWLVTSLSDVLNCTRQEFANDRLWQNGRTLYVATRKRHLAYLQEELETRQKYKLPATLLSEQEIIRTKLQGFAGALALGNEHTVHPVALLLHLCRRIESRSGLVFENTPVHNWTHQGDHFTVNCGAGFSVQAKNLVLATGLKSSDTSQPANINRGLVPVVGHVFVTQAGEDFAAMARESGTLAMWDSLQLYHYVRYLPDGRVLVGGEETPGAMAGKVLNASNPQIEKLYQWAQEHHSIKLPPIEFCWRASLVIPADGLPLVNLQRLGKSTLVSAVTDGLPFGLLLGRLIAQSLQTPESPPVQLTGMLSGSRRRTAATRLLQMVPGASNSSPARALALRAAFTALRLRDLVF